jgi:signal transduction histidine kinase
MPKLILKLTLIFLLASIGSDASAQSEKELIEQINEARSDTARVNRLNRLCLNLNWTKPDTCLVMAKQALQLSDSIDYPIGRALSFQSFCRAYTVLGKYPLATEYGLQSRSLFEELKDSAAMSGVMADIALCYREQGDGAAALKYLLDAKRIAVKLNFSEGAIQGANGMLSSVYDLLNEPDSTLKYGRQAQVVSPYWSSLPYYIGRALDKKNMTDSAIVQYWYGLMLSEQQKIWIDVIDYHNIIAEALIRKNKIDSAVYHLNQSLSVGARGIYPKGMMKSAALLGNMYTTVGRPDSALKYLRLQIALQDSLFNREKIVAVEALDFKEKQKQLLLQQREKDYQNKIMVAILLAILVITLIVLLAIGNVNRTRRKTMRQLELKNEEIEKQKNLAEQALSELKNTQTQLIQSEKMASLGELTAGIAHEIQNPLNFVNNFSSLNTELVAEGLEAISSGNLGDAKEILHTVAENEQKILQHGKRADAIVKGMLQHSRTTTGVKELTDLNALCDEYLRLAYHGMRAKDKSFNSDFNFTADQNIGKIKVLPQDIGRVILNLINNAFYAVKEKSAAGDPNYKPLVEVSTSRTGNNVTLTVRDNGKGIPSTIKEKIFQPFFTTKPTGEGTGLGLSLSYDIVKAHGGGIQLESEEGQGSIFTVSIPVI